MEILTAGLRNKSVTLPIPMRWTATKTEAFITMFNKHGATAEQLAFAAPDAVIDQLSGILLGKQHQVMLSMACLLCGGHLLIEDKPGVGKTTLAQAIGMTLGLPWTRVQFTSDLLPGDIIGVSIFNQQNNSFEFNPGPLFTSVLLADEINRAPPRAQSALLQAMEERQVSADGQTYPLADEFFVIATQNPADRMGAYPLPESQLDRFLAGIELGYPDPQVERELLRGGDRRVQLSDLHALTDAATLAHWRLQTQRVQVSDKLLDYVQALLQATRNSTDSHNSNGLSPRAGINLIAMARGWAMLHKRQMVLPEDVQAIFPSVAGHRLTGSVSSGHKLAREILNGVSLNPAANRSQHDSTG